MPPKTKKKTKKSRAKSSKCKCSSQVQNTKVSIGGGGGGGGAPIVYATYAPPPPQMPTSMPYETGRGFAPEKIERTPFNVHGVSAQGSYSSNTSQAHSDMSVIDRYFHEADAARHNSYAGSHAAMSEGPGPSGSVYSGSSVNMSHNTMSTSSVTNNRSRSVPPTQNVGGSFSIPPTEIRGRSRRTSSSSMPPTEIIGGSRGKAPSSVPSTQAGNSIIRTPAQRGAGKLPMRPISESGTYRTGHISNSSGSVNPNAIFPRASGQRSYGSMYELPGEMAGKFARVSKEAFMQAQRQKDLNSMLRSRKLVFKPAKKNLQIGGANQ